MSALSRPSRWGLRSIALVYLSALLIVPVAMIFYRTFEHGLGQPLDAIPARMVCMPSG
jgi:sulfate transport system permease protein